MRRFGRIALATSLALIAGLATIKAKHLAAGVPRRVIYSFVQSDAFVIVTVQETPAGAKGDVVVSEFSASNGSSYRGAFHISHSEFEQIWSTINAPGVVKRRVTGSSMDISDDYVFRDGHEQLYYIAKASSAPAISALAFRLRAFAEQAMTRMTRIPRTTVTALEVIDHGIYDRGPIESVKSPSDSRLIKKTDVIPIRAGYYYGVRYRLRGGPPGAPVNVTYEFTFPKSQDPKTGKWTTHRREHYMVVIGEVYFAGLFFRDQTEYAEGENKVRIFVDSKLLVEQVFHVVAAK